MDFTNIKKVIGKTDDYDPNSFDNVNTSFKHFTLSLNISRFRHLREVNISFNHPVTLISGTNKIGKTSVLLLLACSHEEFWRLDASKPEPTFRQHIWKDVMAFTKYETENKDYNYRMSWRIGKKSIAGEGKRLASSQAWSGLGKKAADNRTNAKVKGRHVRLVDMDRLMPARTFSASLLRKSGTNASKPLNADVCKAFCYILEIEHTSDFSISEVSGHVNKRCYVVKSDGGPYSSYNSASGEESLISILRDSIESPEGSLILIDEIEAGLHPSVQRRLADVLSFVAWEHKKQFVISTHSSTVIASFPSKSRKFLEVVGGEYKVINGISPQAALSKMDAIGHPLVTLYCEDQLAKFLITKVLIEITKVHPSFAKLIDIFPSGAASDVKTDFVRHKARYGNVRANIGYCAVFDGDMSNLPQFSSIKQDENVYFMPIPSAPEKFLVSSYLLLHPNTALSVFFQNDNHHALFGKMVSLSLASDLEDARNQCFDAFKSSAQYEGFSTGMRDFLRRVVNRFTDPSYSPS